MNDLDDRDTKMAGLFVAIILFIMIFTGMGLWISGSAITSIIKVTAGDCGQTYKMEEVLDGDWLCFEER